MRVPSPCGAGPELVSEVPMLKPVTASLSLFPVQNRVVAVKYETISHRLYAYESFIFSCDEIHIKVTILTIFRKDFIYV